MKAAVFDIETTALEAVGAGIILCAVVMKAQDNRASQVYRLEYREDWNSGEAGFLEREEAELLKRLVDSLSEFDLLIGHNIEQFDLPYLRTRCLQRGIPCLLNPFVYDTMRALGRTKLRTSLNHYGRPSKRLDYAIDLLGLKQEKTTIYPTEHWMSIWGKTDKREEAMLDIIRHCQSDVRMTYQLYRALLPMDMKGLIRRWT